MKTQNAVYVAIVRYFLDVCDVYPSSATNAI